MPYKISGTLGNDARIIVLNEAKDTIVASEAKSAGNFEFRSFPDEIVNVIAIKNDGEVLGYGNVSSIWDSHIIEDDFSGSSLDATKWETYIVPAAAVSVGGGSLNLQVINTDLHCGALCYTKDSFPKNNIINLTCEWYSRSDVYQVGAFESITFYEEDAGNSRSTYYGSVNDDYMQIGLDIGNNRYVTLWGPYTDQVLFASDKISAGSWHTVNIVFNTSTGAVAVTIDGDTANGTLHATDLANLGDRIRIDMNTRDYNRNGITKFRNFEAHYVQL